MFEFIQNIDIKTLASKMDSSVAIIILYELMGEFETNFSVKLLLKRLNFAVLNLVESKHRFVKKQQETIIN